MSAPANPAYPVLPAEGYDDPRFTFGLLFDVKGVIEAHGYPPVANGRDLTELRQALFRFLYGTTDKWRTQS